MKFNISYPSFKNMLIVVLVALAIILYLQPCNNKEDEAKRWKNENEVNKKIFDREIAVYKDSIAYYKSGVDSATKITNEQKYITNAAFVELNTARNRIKELVGTVQILSDTSNRTPYSVVCDSLAIEAEANNFSIVNIQNQYDELNNRFEKERKQRDSLFVVSEKARLAAVAAFYYQYRKSNQLYNDLRPRNALYIGGKIAGNIATPINQVGGTASFVTKGGKMYDIGTGLQLNGTWYAEIGAKFKISFRK